MQHTPNFAIVTPLANEEKNFEIFIGELTKIFDELQSGIAYLIVDDASLDNTLALCQSLSKKDFRFITVYAPENKNVVDAYIRGYREANKNNHEYIIEMDAGMSHRPSSIPIILSYLESGYECVYGSRFLKGGEMFDSSAFRVFLSRGGTMLANFLLGTKLNDMTSGYQGFSGAVVAELIKYPLKSKAHFYQTEVRYLFRKRKHVEVPIIYKATSAGVSCKSIFNSFSVLCFYFFQRVFSKPAFL
jgi:dolichol-phosphate mannosyltransferase